ncbi:MAG TPA: DUF3068 domain-containing protein [Marmoricola sp.]|jgi:hypothetical protein|nr:DUF3068 domain-containing protein [Marmoricola sp.]
MSVVLIVIGAFLIVLGPMIRWYAYPRLAVAPTNERTLTGLVGENATIFDVTSLKDINTTLHTTVRTTGDSSTPSKCPGDVTYVNSTSTTSSDGVMRSRNIERMTFNRRTGEAVKCGNDFISNAEGVQTPIVHKGIVAFFPFDTQKKTYEFWDNTALKAYPIKYEGTAKIEGTPVYKFGQTIAPTQYGTQEVPLSLLGLSGSQNVTGQEMYSVNRTLWVEPNTGVIIKRTESQNQTLNYNGVPRLVLSKATVGYDAKTIRTNLDDYAQKGKLLHLVRAVIPEVSFVLGLIMLIGGIVLGRRRPTTTGGTRVREMADATA